MPRYECKGNIWHNDVYYPKGSFAELPEGEKSDLFVLIALVPKVEAPKAVAFAEEHTPAEAPKSKGAASSKK